MSSVVFEEEQCIVFNADADGRKIICAISYDAMNEYFEAEESDPLFAFMMARSAIEKLAEKMISNGLGEAGKLVITKEFVKDNI